MLLESGEPGHESGRCVWSTSGEPVRDGPDPMERATGERGPL